MQHFHAIDAFFLAGCVVFVLLFGWVLGDCREAECLVERSLSCVEPRLFVEDDDGELWLLCGPSCDLRALGPGEVGCSCQRGNPAGNR